MTNKGRKSSYVAGKVEESAYTKSHPQKLVEYMSEGMLDTKICALFNISRDTFYRWRREFPEFETAYQLGFPKCESWWTDEMIKCWKSKDEKGFKYCISIMNNKFGWKDKGEVTHNVNIQSTSQHIHVINNRAEYLEVLDQVKDLATDLNVIDMIPLENKNEE